MKLYFEYIGNLCGTGHTTLIQPWSGRMRGIEGNTDYCAACNSHFQGLAADGAKAAFIALTRACYDVRERSPLYGSRVVFFVHDEFMIEIPTHYGWAHVTRAADTLASVMIAHMKLAHPDVTIRAEPALSWHWIKGAKTIRRDDGVLLPYEQEGMYNATFT